MTRIEKPPYGSPCNNCGGCCEQELCPLGTRFFGKTEGPCQALNRLANGESICDLAASPAKWHPLRAAVLGEQRLHDSALILIGASHGCDALLKGEAENAAYRERLKRLSAKQAKRAVRAFMDWNGSLSEEIA